MNNQVNPSSRFLGWWWLPVIAACLRAASLPGWLSPWMVIVAVVLRIAYWEGGGTKKGDYLGGYIFWALAFTILLETAPFFPLGAGFIMGWMWLIEGVCYRYIRKLSSPLIAAPCALVATQYAYANWFFGGVPWAGWSLGFAEFPIALKLASVVGEFGVSCLVVALGAWIYFAIRFVKKDTEQKVKTSTWLAWPAIIALLLVLAEDPPKSSLKPIPFLGVQPNIGLGAKTMAGGELGIFKEHCRLAGDYLATSGEMPPPLLVWSETMFLLPATLPGSSGEIRRPRRRLPDDPLVMSAASVVEIQIEATKVASSILPEGGKFLTGAHLYLDVAVSAPSDEMSPRASKSLLFDQSGTLLEYRGKSELVPFGESLPFEGRFPGGKWLTRFIFDNFGLSPDFLRDVVAAPIEMNLPEVGEVKIGSAICWENAYEHVFRKQASEGAECFFILSNEAWYGVGAEMLQMIASTRFRAAETGRSVARVTNTGITSVVAPNGEILAQLPAGEPGVLSAKLPRCAGDQQTLYLRGGWLFAPIGFAISCLLMSFAYIRKMPNISA